MSDAAYAIGSVLITGGGTVHDLANSIACDGLTDEAAGGFLLDALVELCRDQLVSWSVETDYGRVKATRPTDLGERSLRMWWSRCFEPHGLRRQAVPGPEEWTIAVDPTDSLYSALVTEDHRRGAA